MGASNTAGSKTCARLLLMVFLQVYPKIFHILVSHQHTNKRKEYSDNILMKQRNKGGKESKHRSQHQNVLNSSLPFFTRKACKVLIL